MEYNALRYDLTAEAVKKFNSISLDELNSIAALQKRVDTKFILSEKQLAPLLNKLITQYKILSINDEEIMEYNTLYFDSQNFRFYKEHHNGKIKRTKVRIRNYSNTGAFFIEVKQKNGRGDTCKFRKPIQNFESELSKESLDFIQNHSGLKDLQIAPTLKNKFNRITLVNEQAKERLTIDSKISYTLPNKQHGLENLVVVELKQERLNKNSPLFQFMYENHVKPRGFSKYCIGITNLYPDVKRNRFQPVLKILNKIKYI